MNKRQQLVNRLNWRKRQAREAGDYLRLAENVLLQRRDEATFAAQRVADAEVELREYEAERKLARKLKPILVLRYFGGTELQVASVKLYAATK